MAGLFDKQAEIYKDARPIYPTHWYSTLASLTPLHSLAWDAGTGNGQAAIGVAEHYEKVIATDVSKPQLDNALPHPRVHYFHTPLSMSEDELVNLIGGDGSVDLVTVATAVHWFDLPSFYSVVTRLLRKPGGVLAVWSYNGIVVNPTFDDLAKRFYNTTLPFLNPKAKPAFDSYKTLPFPFESVGLGSEGNPTTFDILTELSLEGIIRFMRSWSAVQTAKDHGVDLLNEEMVKEFEHAWGGLKLIKTVNYKAFALVGRVK